jgi:hypothetical protein
MGGGIIGGGPGGGALSGQLLLFVDRHFMADHAPDRGSGKGVMMSHVAGDAADHRATQAAGVCRRGGHRQRHNGDYDFRLHGRLRVRRHAPRVETGGMPKRSIRAAGHAPREKTSGGGVGRRSRGQVIGQVFEKIADRQTGCLGHLLDLVAAERRLDLLGTDRQVRATAGPRRHMFGEAIGAEGFENTGYATASGRAARRAAAALEQSPDYI